MYKNKKLLPMCEDNDVSQKYFSCSMMFMYVYCHGLKIEDVIYYVVYGWLWGPVIND